MKPNEIVNVPMFDLTPPPPAVRISGRSRIGPRNIRRGSRPLAQALTRSRALPGGSTGVHLVVAPDQVTVVGRDQPGHVGLARAQDPGPGQTHTRLRRPRAVDRVSWEFWLGAGCGWVGSWVGIWIGSVVVSARHRGDPSRE